MAKLYIFGIGGTGSRVLRAFTMMLAAGVKLDSSIDTVVPIIIDPDSANGDMNRTADILTKYQEIKKPFENEESGFFNVKIKTLSQLTGTSQTDISDNFKFEINGTHSQKFRDYIGYNSLDNNSKAFIDLLFSAHNLAADMDVGFKGNPNIGSVVLNQFTQSEEFTQFLDSFGNNDRVFIISSIFGGTGASGFPLLLKNLREMNANDGQAYQVRNAVIGALTVLPYFKLKSGEATGSEIDSTSFLGKSKAALAYYERTIVADKRLNSFYYIGDEDGGMYDNFDGKDKQKNNAHFVELAGALAILNFAAEADNLSTTNGKADNPTYKEFGIESKDVSLTFKSLGYESFTYLIKPLAQLTLFSKFLKLGLPKAISASSKWVEEAHRGVPKHFFKAYYYTNSFSKFIHHYDEWLNELEDNSPSFKPFNNNVDSENALEFIDSYPPKKKFFLKDASMDLLEKKVQTTFKSHTALTDETKFVKTFYDATEEVLAEKLGI